MLRRRTNRIEASASSHSHSSAADGAVLASRPQARRRGAGSLRVGLALGAALALGVLAGIASASSSPQLAIVAAPAAPAPACGNGVREVGEACDDAAANGTAASCCDATCMSRPADTSCRSDGDACTSDVCTYGARCIHIPLEDSDADGMCDAGDVCTNVGFAQKFATRPPARLMLDAVEASPRTDTFTLRAEFALASSTSLASIDPLANGVRIVVRGADGATVHLDQALPGGARVAGGARGWKTNASRTAWSYVDASAAPLSGIKRVLIQSVRRAGRERVKVQAVGRGVGYPVNPHDMPVEATIVLGNQSSAMSGACGESAFRASDCAFDDAQSRLTCTR